MSKTTTFVLLCCVSCAQLTDNVTLSTALALQRFIDSCDNGILQANDRSDEEATDMPPIDEDVFARATVSNNAARRGENLTCGLCYSNYDDNLRGQKEECCGHGECVNGACQCVEG